MSVIIISQEYPKLFAMLWKRLTDLEHVMHVQKALILVEYLLRYGSERFIADAKRRARDVAQLQKYKHYDDNNQDDGGEVRKKAKSVYEMISDDARLSTERQKAQKIRENAKGFGNMSYGDTYSSPYGNYTENEEIARARRERESRWDEPNEPQSHPQTVQHSHRNATEEDEDPFSSHASKHAATANNGESKEAEKEKKKKKKKEKESGEVSTEGGEKEKKKKKKRDTEAPDNDDPFAASASHGVDPFANAPAPPSPQLSAAAAPAPAAVVEKKKKKKKDATNGSGSGAPSAAAQYAAMASASSASGAGELDLMSLASQPTLALNKHNGGDIDILTGTQGVATSDDSLVDMFAGSSLHGGGFNNNVHHQHHPNAHEDDDVHEHDSIAPEFIAAANAQKKAADQKKTRFMECGFVKFRQFKSSSTSC